MWLSVCMESWESLSIFLRVSQKQLLEYQQLLKHRSLWERPWSASWDRSPACGLLHRNRGTDCFRDTSCAHHWSTCHCWPAWKRGPPAEYWVASWEQRIEITQRKSSQWMRLPEIDLPCSGELWQYQRQKLFLASGSETQQPFFLPTLHSSICSLVPSNSDQWSLLKHTYPGTRWVFLVPGQRQDSKSNQRAFGNNNGIEYYSPNLIRRYST